MRKIIYLLVLVCSLGYGQNKFELKPDGFSPIVTEIQGKTAAEIYKKAKDWVQTYYKNPKEVLKADIENDMIRIDGFCDKCLNHKIMGASNLYNYSYSITISFQDGKFKFDYAISSFDSGVLYINSYSEYYKKDGTLKSKYSDEVQMLNNSANDTYQSFLDYVTGKKKDW